MEHALPRRPAGIPRTWSLCMISENHGTVGPAGCTFSHAPEKHERVLVVEMPAAAGAPADQINLRLVGGRKDLPVAEFEGYVDGEPLVRWMNRDNMPRVGTKLFAGAAAAEVEMDAGFLQWVHDRMRFVHGENENVDYMHKLRAIIASVPDDRKTPNVASAAQQAAAPGAQLVIGVAAPQGATISIMQPHADGTTTVIYGGTHPAGDSMGRAVVAAAPSALGTPEAPQTAAARDVLAERQRQVEQEGWTPAHDDAYVDGQLASAAVAYAQAYTPYLVPSSWPWAVEWFKAGNDRRNMVKAGALILAEIERLDRAAAPKGGA